MIKKILAAYDGSELAVKAYTYALDLAKKYAADLLVLAVARPPEPPEDVKTEAILENANEHFKELFKSLKVQADAQGVTPRFDVVVGHLANQIVSRAEQDEVDLIVMGHRGKAFFERLLVGSVSKQVMTHTHCAVMVVR
jgi:nucleotide-binding universal stress UspA family protein